MLDTTTIVAAFRSQQGGSNQLLVLAARREVTLVASVALFLEYEAVLSRAEQVLAHGLSPQRVRETLEDLADIIEPVDIHFQWRPQLRDPDDELVLEAAVNGRADVIVTHNARDFAPAASFGIRVETPKAFLRRMR